MKNLKISQQLLLLVFVLITALAGVTYYLTSSSITSIYAERYEMLRTQVESARSILQSYYDQEKAGALTHEEAQKLAYVAVAAMKYEPAGYVGGLSYDGITVLNPNPKSIGANAAIMKDATGTLFAVEMIKKGRAGGGITTYLYEKPGDSSGQPIEKSAYSQAFEPWQVVLLSGVYMDDLQAKVRQTTFTAAGVGIVIALAAIALAVLIVRNITGSLADVHLALEAVANENVAIKIPNADLKNEVGMMAKATQLLQEKVRERHAMAARQEQQQLELDRERRHNSDLQQQDAAAQALVVSTIGEALASLAQGDLMVRCADLGPRYEALRRNFNEALRQLEVAMSEVNSKGIDIGGSKEEIRRASAELSQRTERQAANLEETSAALDELAVAVRQTAEGAREAAQRVTTVSSEASRSDAVVTQAIDAMGDIEHSSEEISKIIGVIDEIAFQTNLLALNAGVEAARAGESGKGFAVVAQEVRELAQRSAAAAKEIKDQIARSSSQVENGVRLVGEAGEALKRISAQVKAASDVVGKIAHSASEQDTTLRSISSSLNQLDAATQHNAAMAEETTASAEALAVDTDDLLALISRFRVSESRNEGSELSRMAQRMRRAG